MSLEFEQTLKVLSTLRKLFNYTDEYQAEPGRSLEFTEQVKSDIEEIVRYGLHKDVTGWGARCQKGRKENYYTAEEVAELLGVCHKAIQMQEGTNKSTNINPFYLEAFALLYHRTPYYFIGLPSPHLHCPFGVTSSMLDQCCNIIMGSLYDEDDPIKLDYLKTIIQIASLNSPKYQILVHFLDNTKTFYGITTVSNINHPKADDDSWRYTPITPLLDTNQRNSAEYSKREIFWRAYYILQDLEVHYPARLPVLAKLAVCDTNAAEILRYIIFNLGFPKDPKSLHSYSVDNVITHPPHSYGHRTRRFTNLYPSGQNNETLLADTCRKNNFPHKQTIFYYPDFNLEYYSGVPFKTIAPTPSTHTIYPLLQPQAKLPAAGFLPQPIGSCLKENQDLIPEILEKTIFCFFICLLDRERFIVAAGGVLIN